VTARFAHHLLQQITRPVGHLRLLGEIVIALHKNADAHDAEQFIPVPAQFAAGDAEGEHRALRRRLLRQFQRHGRGNFSNSHQHTVAPRQLSADIQQIPRPNARHVRSDRLGRRRQRPAQRGQFGGNIHRRNLSPNCVE